MQIKLYRTHRQGIQQRSYVHMVNLKTFITFTAVYYNYQSHVSRRGARPHKVDRRQVVESIRDDSQIRFLTDRMPFFCPINNQKPLVFAIDRWQLMLSSSLILLRLQITTDIGGVLRTPLPQLTWYRTDPHICNTTPQMR